MPSRSPAQHRLMEMVAHDPAASRRVGIPQAVGEEFSQADQLEHAKAQARALSGPPRKPSPAR